MFSGFGLGTLLMPAYALFMPVELAVAATAVVHAANGLLKGALLGRRADRTVVLRFGVPAILAAFVGAWALGELSSLHLAYRYGIGGLTATVTPVNLVMGALMIAFAIAELHPALAHARIDPAWLPAGGLLSGFFGGLSGHQGALRSAFLVKTGLTTTQFVGTNAVLGLLVDTTRIAVYAAAGHAPSLFGAAGVDLRLVLVGMVAAFTGVLVGRRWLTKVTMRSVQWLTGVLLVGIGSLLAAGLL